MCRFQDIIAEEYGFPTTQDKKRFKREWDELEAAIYEVDQNYKYEFNWNYGISIDDLVSVQPMVTAQVAFGLNNYYGITISGIYLPSTNEEFPL